MLKMLVVTTFIASFTSSMLGQPDQAHRTNEDAASELHRPSTSIDSHDTYNNPQQGPAKSSDQPARWYAPAKRPEWWLVVLGFLTLGFIGWQAWETRKAAEAGNMAARAALKQAEIQQESLRPRLTIGFDEGPYYEMVNGKPVVLHPAMINTGGVPAYGVIAETWIEWLDRPFEFTQDSTYHRGEPFTVHPGKPTHYKVPFRALTGAEIDAFHNASSTICLRIRLKYKALGVEAHTEEAFSVEPKSMSILAKYSEAT